MIYPTIMPLYSYIPFLDPGIDGNEKCCGYKRDTDDELDTVYMENENPKSAQRTTVDSFKQKVNENLINFNNKMSDLLQDGLGGVDNICKRVQEVMNDNKRVYTEKYMVNCARGDIYGNIEETRYITPDPSQRSKLFINREQEEKIQEIYNNDNDMTVFSMQKKSVSKDDNLPTSSKREKTRSRSSSKSLNAGKSDQKRNTNRLNSKSFEASVKSFLNKKSSEKIKSSKTKPKKKTAEADPKPVVENSAKKRLGQIEKDYQKVVENLGKVERMMACVNERIKHQSKKDQTSMETVKGKGLNILKDNTLIPSKSHNFTERNIEHTKSKKKAPIPTDPKSNNDTKMESAKEDISQKEVLEGMKRSKVIKEDKKIEEKKVEKKPKEVVRQKQKGTKDFKQSGNDIKEKSLMETEEERIAEEILKQMKSIEKINNTKLNSEKLEEPRKNAEQLGALNPLSNIKINDSLTDMDTMIDNAVMELGNLLSTDFDISCSSSDVSFKPTTDDGAQTLYDECHLLISSSTSSTNAQLGEESDKFAISQSFQQLKESYVHEIRQKATDMKKEARKIPKECDAKNVPEVRMKNSYDQLHEEIFNDSSWNGLDPVSFKWTFLTNPTQNSNSSIDLRGECPSDNNSLNADQGTIKSKNEQVHSTEESNLRQKKMNNVNEEHQTEEMITVPQPPDKQHISNIENLGDCIPKTKNTRTEQLNEEGEYAYVDKNKRICDQNISGSDLVGFPRTQQQQKIIKDMNEKRTSPREKAKIPKSATKEEEYYQSREEGEDVITKEGNKTKTKLQHNFRTKHNKSEQFFESQEIKEIKKMEINYSEDSSDSSFLSFGDGTLWANKDENEEELKPIDPMEQVSILCKKLIGDLVVEEEPISLEEIMNGYFNAPLIQSLVYRSKRPRSVRIITPIQDPDLRSIVPEVHRKKALPDLHERMEYQIRQTDSFDGFLNLMNKNRRKAIIKQAEKQDHNVRCQMKTCFRKRYPFRVVTASVPPGYDHKLKEKKEPEKRYINSLWFSPKDFKLRRNSRIFNRKRMEMYCQSLNKAPIVPKSKYGETTTRENKKIEKASNYSILVRSGTPLGRRPNTPRRWIQHRPPTPAGGNSHRLRLHHCDILDDLTLKDLAPFNAEYPRNDDRHRPESLEGSLLYRLACGGQKGDADGTLMELVTPKLSCTQEDCKVCRCKSKLDKRPARKIRSPRKSGDESSVTSTKAENQNLTPKAAAQLLIQNIGEIKSKKSSTKSQASEKSLNKNTRRSKSLRKNSRKVLAEDSKLAIQQRLEENMVKRIFQNHHVTITDFAPKSTPTQRMRAFQGVDHFQKILKVPELYSRPPTRKSNTTKLFPYINDPDNKVFQNITVLPVKVFYNFEPLKDLSRRHLGVSDSERTSPRGNRPINITSLSETDELEVSTVEYRRPSTGDEKKVKKKTSGRRRIGTPKNPAVGSRQIPNKFCNIPPNRTLPPPPTTSPVDITLSQKSKEIMSANKETLNSPKTSPRRLRCRRSSSLGKSSESDNQVSQLIAKRPGNPNPWKPASRRPRTPKTPPLLKSPMRIRSTEKSQIQPCKTISAGRISPKHSTRSQHKCLPDSPRPVQEAKGQNQMQSLVKERRMRFELNPAKNFYNIDLADSKSNTTRASIHRCRPLSPRQRVMVDHLHMLRNRNTRLQGNIQKAINIIEEKMVDVLSTNDQSYKKKTIDRMEKEINKVLRMINEQNSIMNERKEHNSESIRQDVQEISKTDSRKCVSVASKQTPDDDSQMHTKALVTHTLGLKMPRPPRKRSISRVLKFHCRPSTVEEEKSLDLTEEYEVSRINKETSSQEAICKTKEETKVEEKKEQETTSIREELYPSSIINKDVDTQLCPLLRCPTPKTSATKLSQKTRNILKKMSREAFGKFADVVKTKTRLIIDMTERIDMDDTNLLPNPRVTSALPAILARSTNMPVITTIHQPRPSDVMSTTVSSIVTVHQTPIESFLNRSVDPLSGATTEISQLANLCTERSLTSFSESERYTWRKIEPSQPLTCSLKRKIPHDLTPFMRALNNLKAGTLFEKRHQLLPIEETSPNFRKMMSFLEGLSKIKETVNRKMSRDVQLIWNPEKRSSFHNSLTGTKKFRFRKNIKAISEHSMVQCPPTSITELISTIKIEENPSEPIGDTNKNPQIQTDSEEQTQKTEMEKPDEAKNEIMDSYLSELQQEHKRDCKLVMSEVQLISISNTKNLIKKQKKRPPISSLYKEPIPMLKDDRYSNFLKFFYFIFYTLVYFCMSTMNFSC